MTAPLFGMNTSPLQKHAPALLTTCSMCFVSGDSDERTTVSRNSLERFETQDCKAPTTWWRHICTRFAAPMTAA